LTALAADLVGRQVTVIAANTPAAPVAKALTTTTPIVFVTATDPVAAGLVGSLNRPGGNLTGVALLNEEIGAKRLELLHQVVPTATVMAALINPSHPGAEFQTKDLQAAASTLGLQIHFLQATSEKDFDGAFAALLDMKGGALVIGSDGFFIDKSEQLAALTLRHAIPAIFLYREFVAAGGLMGYASSLADGYRLMGVYTGRVLKGETPGELPVQRAVKLQLVINLKTAKALGLTIPEAFLLRADEVIE
jgi:putative ABC transport system substrate-binding protein